MQKGGRRWGLVDLVVGRGRAGCFLHSIRGSERALPLNVGAAKEIKFENIKELHYILDNAEPELAFRSMARIAFTRINYEKFELSHENETFSVFLQRKLNE